MSPTSDWTPPEPAGSTAGSGKQRLGGRAPARLLSIVTGAALLALLGCGASATPGRPPALVAIGAGLHGPAGLKSSVYAKGPSTAATFAFDPQGRLWVAAAGLETHGQDGVFEISRAGGTARRILSGLKDPLGLAWYAGRLFVASLGRVDAYGEFDGKRFTEHSKILTGPLPGGENNELVMATDGRFLMGITASCDHCRPASKWSGAIASFRPDGSGMRLFAGRLRAPVGLAFLPGTSDLLVSVNQRDDLGPRTPGDWLTVVREGQNWGFPGCFGQGGPACSGVPKPTVVLDKHAAVGAIAPVAGQLGPAVGTAVLVAEWESGKVQRVTLTRAGADYRGSVAPFLTGIANPLAIALAPDGSLLVGDWSTGTIYRISRA